MKLVPLPSRCGQCKQDHEEMVLTQSCCPVEYGTMAVAYPKLGVVEIQCMNCRKVVAKVKAEGLIDEEQPSDS